MGKHYEVHQILLEEGLIFSPAVLLSTSQNKVGERNSKIQKAWERVPTPTEAKDRQLTLPLLNKEKEQEQAEG